MYYKSTHTIPPWGKNKILLVFVELW